MKKEKNLQPRKFYPGRLSFRFNEEIKNTYEQKMNKFGTTNEVFNKC